MKHFLFSFLCCMCCIAITMSYGSTDRYDASLDETERSMSVDLLPLSDMNHDYAMADKSGIDINSTDCGWVAGKAASLARQYYPWESDVFYEYIYVTAFWLCYYGYSMMDVLRELFGI